MRLIDADALIAYCDKNWIPLNVDAVNAQPTIQPEKRTETHACDLRRYTFGNDEFNLEAAYHDCKLVFDGITDDDSFQEADTGLILYYANEIIYALHEALQGDDTNVLSNDCISRQAAIKEAIPVRCEGDVYMMVQVETLEGLPSVEPDLSDYSDKLWKAAYERGRAEALAERKTGRWICKMTKDHIGCNVKLYMCSECNGWSGDYTYMFCPHCGAYVGGE